MIFTKEELQSIKDANKLLKCKVLVVIPGFPGMIIGTDDIVSYLKIIPFMSDKSSIWSSAIDTIPFTVSLPESINYLENISLSNQIDLDFNLSFNLLYKKVCDGYNRIMEYCSINPSVIYENIQSGDFNRIITLPASYGASNYIIDNSHCIYLYQGLIPATKSDKVNLTIYDFDDFTFVSKFTVDKGKKGLITIYLLCRRL